MALNAVSFVATRRNGRALCFGGYYYHINKSVDERSYWKCRTKGCKSTVVTIKDAVSSASGLHFHEPNDSRVVLPNGCADTPNTAKNNSQIMDSKAATMHNESAVKVENNKRQRINDSLSNSVKRRKADESCDDELGVEIKLEVDETGQVDIDNGDDEDNANKEWAPHSLQMMPTIKPNSIYFTNNYTTIEHFDMELNNLFEVVRQSGFASLDIEQLSADWQMWKRRYLELKRLKRVKPQTNETSNSNADEVQNLQLQLEIANNARTVAEREAKRVQRSYKELQNTVVSLRLVLRKNLFNSSNNQCIALLNEINELKRKVCAQVETHQANLNEVKRLLCLDDNELRTEFEQLAQERDEALRENHELRQEIELLRYKLAEHEDST